MRFCDKFRLVFIKVNFTYLNLPYQWPIGSAFKTRKREVPVSIPGQDVDVVFRSFKWFSSKLAKIWARILRKTPYGGHPTHSPRLLMQAIRLILKHRDLIKLIKEGFEMAFFKVLKIIVVVMHTYTTQRFIVLEPKCKLCNMYLDSAISAICP